MLVSVRVVSDLRNKIGVAKGFKTRFKNSEFWGLNKGIFYTETAADQRQKW